LKNLILLAVLMTAALSQNAYETHQYRTTRTHDPLVIDGILEEEIWSKAVTTSGFIQRKPNSGQPATQKTEVMIVYDDDYLYVAARLFDSEPDKIAAQLFRRDGDGYSDWFEVMIDSYYDHRTAFGFQINPKGVLKDNLYYNDNDNDVTWDAVWEGASNIDGQGWTTEIRIPFSQLRFDVQDEEMTWGLQFWRSVARNDERLFWAPILEESQGFVSNFGTLTGLVSKKQPRRIEILPYTSGKLLMQDGDKSDPYYNANDLNGNIGLDFKYGLGSNFTLTGTINPDFGQVEADPAVVNLSANETYFRERRPFFLEGTDIFSFGRTVTFNSNSPPIFYSRRIGRYPRGKITDPAMIYADYPDQTSILGAIKISGKTSNGISIGVLNALTSEESAAYIDTLDKNKSEVVEPLGNSFVTRVKKDFRKGKSSLGGFITSSYKDVNTEQLKNTIRKNAVVAGVDFEHKLKNEDWVFSGYFSNANISGSKAVITAAQRSPARYYQRPDQDYVEVDSNATSLSGYSYELSLMKNSGKHWQGSMTYGEISPGYELNDLGFQNGADYRSLNSFLLYMENTPGNTFRDWNAYLGHWSSWTMGGQHAGLGLFWGSNFNFNNFWNLEIEGNFGLDSKSINLTRGGPAAERAPDWRIGGGLSTDSRKAFILGIGGGGRRDKSGEYDKYIWADFTFRPFPFLSTKFEANLSGEKDTDQFIKSITDDLSVNTYGKRYVFSDIKSETQSFSAQVDWTFAPELTLQFFVSPYVTAYNYEGLKEFRTPGKYEFDYYGDDKGSLIVDENGKSMIDPDGSGPAESFSIGNKDFNFRSIRLNAVLRWEYSSGSTLFFVWQQERDSFQSGLGQLNIADDYKALFKTKAINSFVVKVSYWLGY